MNKVITINLGGMAYQLEEGGYDTLRAYMETASARLQGNPDRDEILADVEWAIGEKFRALLGNHKTVVVAKEVSTVLTEMGPVEAGSGETAEPNAGGAGAGAASGAGASSSTGTGGSPFKNVFSSVFGSSGSAGASGGTGPAPKRLHRIQEGAMLAGVCNGIGAYFHIDPTFVRLAFVFLTLLWGMGLVVYIIMAIVVPEAHTPEQRAAATGDPSTTQDFVRRARAGYYEAIKGFPDHQARREWQRRFGRDMRAHADQWRSNWRGYWAQRMPMHPGMWFLLPVLSVLHGLATVAWVCAMVSLLATGTVFGQALPPNVPVWVAVMLVMILYGLVVGPLKVVRHTWRWGVDRSRPSWALLFLVDGIIWIAVVGALALLGFHYFPEVNQAVHALPPQVHQAINDVQAWWQSH